MDLFLNKTFPLYSATCQLRRPFLYKVKVNLPKKVVALLISGNVLKLCKRCTKS